MLDTHTAAVEQRVSTGSLPGWQDVDALVRDAYERERDDRAGDVARYIPSLATAVPDQFGVAVVDVMGGAHDVGDAWTLFSIQSISKAFVYALVADEVGHDAIGERIGVNNTGLGFNSVMAIELNEGHPMNPMVNAGAIATTALIPGATAEEKWSRLAAALSAFAGRHLAIDEAVYASESQSNDRNRAIARLLLSYGRLDDDPAEAVDLYTRQCSLLVSAHDLAVMGATLADGGVNPVSGEQVVSGQVSRDTLAVLAASGLYEHSGEWLFEIGVPGKSGVSGGLVAIAPGKGAIGTFSPRLDAAGNSVRGQRTAAHLSRVLGLNIFASRSAGDAAVEDV
ncbi:glutaminase A [Gryllotalpicola reticulitermitis]|uniref:Glutaminase n=1 Tax=Gryllotalpicola reticulitermitis TaxID=1184153 RepID=A0ABV8Q2Q6_9MICO